MSLPWVCTSARVLPLPFTRDRLIVLASFRSSVVGADPFRVVAFMLSWVPLDRSSPRPTRKSLCHWPGLNRFPPAMASSMITMSAISAAIARPGCGTVFVGPATSPPVPRSVVPRKTLLPAGRSEHVVLVGLGQVAVGRIGEALLRGLGAVVNLGVVVGLGVFRLVVGVAVGVFGVLDGVGLLGLPVGDDLRDRAPHVADVHAGRDLEDDVVAVDCGDGGVHPGRGPDLGAGADGALLLLGLLLAAPLRPDHQEVKADKDQRDQEQERIGAAA